MTESKNSFNAKQQLVVGDKSYDYFALSAVPGMEKLPYSLKVLGENLLRTEDGANITADHIEALMDHSVERVPGKGNLLPHLREKTLPQTLFAAGNHERVFQKVAQLLETSAPAKVQADGAKPPRGQAFPGRKGFKGRIQVMADFANPLLRPRKLAVKLLVPGAGAGKG